MRKDLVPSEEVTVDGAEFLKVTIGEKDFFLPFKVLSGNKVAWLDISGQVDMNEHNAEMLVEEMKRRGVRFDTIMNPAAKSNALAHAIAVRWAKDVDPSLTYTVVARNGKPGEHYDVEAVYRSVTSSTDKVMYLTEDDVEFLKGKSVLLVDDVFGGGGTTKALRELVEKAGATVAAHAVVAIEDSPLVPDDLIYLFTLPIL
jgi:adenine/guanine phosphoribosyltransferase-like PRPP-binding protein